MPNMEAVEAAERFAAAAKKLFPESEIYLFGSQARGEQHEGSDIDVGIIIDSFDDYPDGEAARLLADLYVEAFEINGRIEPSLRAKGDRSGFADVIAATGLRIA